MSDEEKDEEQKGMFQISITGASDFQDKLPEDGATADPYEELDYSDWDPELDKEIDEYVDKIGELMQEKQDSGEYNPEENPEDGGLLDAPEACGGECANCGPSDDFDNTQLLNDVMQEPEPEQIKTDEEGFDWS